MRMQGVDSKSNAADIEKLAMTTDCIDSAKLFLERRSEGLALGPLDGGSTISDTLVPGSSES
jgi:hypothetical protein